MSTATASSGTSTRARTVSGMRRIGATITPSAPEAQISSADGAARRLREERRAFVARDERGVAAAECQQLLVGAALDDLAAFEHDDLVGVADRREPVGDDQR